MFGKSGMGTCRSVRDLTASGKRFAAINGMVPNTINRIALPNPEIEVWLARLDLDVNQVMQCTKLLSGDELSRADRFHFEGDRRRFVVARGVLRTLLGGYLDIAPAALAFSYTQHGKPFTENCTQIHFNVSHSGEHALYAISPSCRLGVDIESLDRDIDYNSLASRFFTPRECAVLLRVPEPDRKRAFLSCWTRKEAVVKALGNGLSLPLDQFEVMAGPDNAPRVLDAGANALRCDEWTLHPIDVDGEYVATVAAHRPK